MSGAKYNMGHNLWYKMCIWKVYGSKCNMRYNLGWQNVILPNKFLIVSIVLIWSLTFIQKKKKLISNFSVFCQFNPCCYLFYESCCHGKQPK